MNSSLFFNAKLLTKKLINAIIILNMVQLGGRMNNSHTTKDAIILKIREIVARDGLNALSIRGLAKELDSSVGIIYYYFPSKDELIVEAIESVWEDIFQADDKEVLSFSEFLKSLFDHIDSGVKKYPNFFTLHTLMLQTNDKSKAKSSMQLYIARLKSRLLEVLYMDKSLKEDAFSDDFKAEGFINLIVLNIMSLILDKNFDKDFFIKAVEKLIY